jgi:hypothetical protein
VTPSSKNGKAVGCTEGWFASCQELENVAFVDHLVPGDGIGHLQNVGLPIQISKLGILPRTLL